MSIHCSWNVWRVTYSKSCDWGTGSSTTAGIERLILTAEGDLESVRATIREGLTCQERLVEVTHAEWLGVADGFD